MTIIYTGWKRCWGSANKSAIASVDISTQDVLNAYRCGFFPMADSRVSEEFYWYDPPMRGQLSIDNLHIPAKLRKTLLKNPYEITVNQNFEAVIDGCAARAHDRDETWINQGIRDLFIQLHKEGHAHSVESRKDDKLLGGLYGLAIGGAFMGESMFSRATDASKAALVALCAQLHRQGFQILDTQFINDHLKQFGAYEIPKAEYIEQLVPAVFMDISFLDNNQQTISFETIKQYINRKDNNNI